MYTISKTGGDPKRPRHGIFDKDKQLVAEYDTPEEAEARLAQLVFDHEDKKKEAAK